MKKFIAALMATTLALSLVACGSTNSATSSNSDSVSIPESVPVQEESDFVKEDISTEEGFKKVVLESPDNNAKDGFWQYFAFENVKNGMPILGNRTSIGHRDKEYTPFYVEPTEFDANVSFVNWYTAKLSSASSNITKNTEKTFGDFVKDISIIEFYDRIGVDISAFVYPDGEEGEVTLTQADEEMLKYVTDEEVKKSGIEKTLAENDWMRFVIPEANVSSKEAADVLESNFYNINHYNDWCKANNLIYNEELLAHYTSLDANNGVIPLDEVGQESYKKIASELIGYTKNYYDAKYNGADLTAPISEEFASVAPMDKTIEWLSAQGLNSENTEFTIDSIYANLYYAFPQVIVNYTVTNKDTGMSVHGTSNFIYKIVETESGYSYELDYILETTTDDFKDTMYKFEESLTENSESRLYIPKLTELY